MLERECLRRVGMLRVGDKLILMPVANRLFGCKLWYERILGWRQKVALKRH